MSETVLEPDPDLPAASETAASSPLVGLIMGSQSDWATLSHAAGQLETLGIGFEARIVSAHRTPDRLADYARDAEARGLQVIIAGAGGAAHLPGMCAAWTQLPAGSPVGTLAIGRAGAVNAALLAAAILALSDPALRARLEAWRALQTASVADAPALDAPTDAPGS
jgi:5-(carboxyamino)imidazole ribonucleotide mutase